MSKMLLAVAFAVVCACTTQAQALAIPKFDKTCLPATAAPLTNFKPEQVFDGTNWYAIAGTIESDDERVTCSFFNATFDATSKNVTLTLTVFEMMDNGTVPEIKTYQFAQDAESNAVYNYEDDFFGLSVQLAVVDTDYTSYTVMTVCLRDDKSDDSQADAFILARTTQKPSNYDAIVAKMTTAGFQTDSADFGLLLTRCPK